MKIDLESYRFGLYAIYVTALNKVEDFATKNAKVIEELLNDHGCQEKDEVHDFGTVTKFFPFDIGDVENKDVRLKTMTNRYVAEIESEFVKVDPAAVCIIRCMVNATIYGCLISFQLKRWAERHGLSVGDFKSLVSDCLYGICEKHLLRAVYDIEYDIVAASVSQTQLAMSVSFPGIAAFIAEDREITLCCDPGGSRAVENELMDIKSWKKMVEATCAEYHKMQVVSLTSETSKQLLN